MIERERLAAALRKAREHLLAARTPEGVWEGRLSSSALSTATALSVLSLAGEARDKALVRAGVAWLTADQNADGGWGDTPESRSNLATALLALSALRLAAADEPETLARAEAYVTTLAGSEPAQRVAAIKAAYGADRTFAVPILMNCALAGLVPWDAIPGLPFELAALPQAWYRAVRLQVVSYALPALIAVGLLLHERNPVRNPLTRLARRLVAGRVRAKLQTLQPDSGGFLEATPLTAFVAMSLTSVFGPQEPTVARGLEFLRASMREDGSWPIDTNLATWVTTAALGALTASAALEPSGGLPEGDAQAIRRWIASGQYQTVHPYTGAPPGGWGWSKLSGAVPDADDTSGAILALAGTSENEAVAAGVRWLLQLQNSDGGWPTFCRGWGALPFDQSCADITAHALRALHATACLRWAGGRSARTQASYIQSATAVTIPGRALESAPTDGPETGAARGPETRAVVRPETRAAMRRGLAYLHRQQRDDGSWLPLWFGNEAAPDKTNPVLGTSRVLMALAELEPDGEPAARACRYLQAAQNADGGWGGAPGIASSVEETALAVAGLSHWEAMAEAFGRGVAYLVRRVEDGAWTQPAPIGLYFASLWYSEELYPVVWTVEALGRAGSLSAQRRCASLA